MAGSTVEVADRRAQRSGSGRSNRPGRRRAWMGQSPIGLLFTAPYLIFVLAIFAYPLIFAGYMSFHDYFFSAPVAVV